MFAAFGPSRLPIFLQKRVSAFLACSQKPPDFKIPPNGPLAIQKKRSSKAAKGQCGRTRSHVCRSHVFCGGSSVGGLEPRSRPARLGGRRAVTDGGNFPFLPPDGRCCSCAGGPLAPTVERLQYRRRIAVFDIDDRWQRGTSRSSDGTSGKRIDAWRDLVGDKATRVGRKSQCPTLWGCLPLLAYRQTATCLTAATLR
jgi:hypothetical protein